MSRPASGDRIVVRGEPHLAAQLQALGSQRMVFVAGLPGTGKSLLAHQIVHLASAAGRTVHLLQWDVARPALEASRAGHRYPLADGVTHPLIRKAAGLWARRAIAAWSQRCADRRHLLVGETPFVGNRFVELAQRLDDDAEPLLAAPSCRFAIAVPSVAVRQFLEGERERRAANPRHPREREDAPPRVLRALWRELTEIAPRLGISTGVENASSAFEPAVYQRVYETVLRHRHVEIVTLDAILPTDALSVYDYAVAPRDLVPTEGEADFAIGEAERLYPDPIALDGDTARWWQVDRRSA
jgi:hypothetical protein